MDPMLLAIHSLERGRYQGSGKSLFISCPYTLVTDDGEYLILIGFEFQHPLTIYRRREHPGHPFIDRGPDHGSPHSANPFARSLAAGTHRGDYRCGRIAFMVRVRNVCLLAGQSNAHPQDALGHNPSHQPQNRRRNQSMTFAVAGSSMQLLLKTHLAAEAMDVEIPQGFPREWKAGSMAFHTLSFPWTVFVT